jgi:predicted nucleic-acid-binding protein
MPGLDTNVLVRWLVDDDPAQVARVVQLFESARAESERLFVPTTVSLELEWVLRSRYRLSPSDVIAAFTALLESHEVDFQGEAALEHALRLYSRQLAEFADCLHTSQCAEAGASPLLSFDQKAACLPGVRWLAV